jgi:hypothetical protein
VVVHNPSVTGATAQLAELVGNVPECQVLVADGDEIAPTADQHGHVRYVVVYPTPGTGYAPALDGQHTAAVGEWQLTCVASTYDEAAWLLEHVRAEVGGQSYGNDAGGLFAEVPGQRPPIRPDRSVRPVRYSGVLLYQANVI